MDNYAWISVLVPFAGCVAGLIASLVFRGLSRAMFLVIAGFGSLCAPEILHVLDDFTSPSLGSGPLGGPVGLTLRGLLIVAGWLLLITGLVGTWQDFAKQKRRAQTRYEEDGRTRTNEL